MKQILTFILSIIDTKSVLDLIITYLEKQASKTETKLDDKAIELIKEYRDRLLSKGE